MFFSIKTWIKNNQKDIFIFIVVALLFSLAFGLGYLYARDFTETPIVINKCSN